MARDGKFPWYVGAWLAPEHMDALRAMAEREERPLSGVIRRLILKEARRSVVEKPDGPDDAGEAA
jgi:hypothetical protein